MQQLLHPLAGRYMSLTLSINGLTSTAMHVSPTNIPDIDLGIRLSATAHNSSTRMPRGHHLSRQIVGALESEAQDGVIKSLAEVVQRQLVASGSVTDQK
jgi:hypothetical protein